jgi:FlaA1/EpsC-like NDP-sugar epimerase
MSLSISRWSILLVDVLIVLLSVVAAYFLRFNFHIPKSEWRLMFWAVSVILGLRLLSFAAFQTFAGAVFYTSIEDARRIFKAITSGTLVLGTINLVLNHLYGYYLMPNSVVIIDYLATMFLMSAMRIFIKIVYLEYKNYNKDRKNIIIYGSNNEAIIAQKTLERDSKTNYNIVAFIGEDSRLQGQKIADITVFDIADLPRLFAANVIDSLIIAVAHITPDRKQELIDIGLAQNVTVRTVPPMERWINGELSARQIREVRIEDLLERAPIQLDTDNLRHQITDKVVLVTGAAGSIGSEIARQLIQFYPKRLILLDQAETPLFELDLELLQQLHFKNHEIVIADVRNKERMQRVFEAFAPQIIYHAAAYKHVPMMENNPSEAILTNIGGTRILADCAVQYGAERFVFVSTDKAVNPTNIMGASKRVAEIYVQSLNEYLRQQNLPKPLFITTRFGNVLGSNGSVIPLFKKQIATGGPLTVTEGVAAAKYSFLIWARRSKSSI